MRAREVALAGLGVGGLRDVRKTLPPQEQGAVAARAWTSQ